MKCYTRIYKVSGKDYLRYKRVEGKILDENFFGESCVMSSTPPPISEVSRLRNQGSSLVVWWLGFGAFTDVVWVQSLVGELRSRKPSCWDKGESCEWERERVA